MYVVKLFAKGKEYSAKFITEREACSYARMMWHLGPMVYKPNGDRLSEEPCPCIDSEY